MTRGRTRIVVAGAAVTALLLVGGPWAYINLVRSDAPDRLGLSSTTVATAPTGPGSVDGTWKATEESIVGYRVKEILFGQSTEGVGRTDDVRGSLVIADDELQSAEFSVDMASVTSDDERRDRQFRSAIMDTATHPRATFVLAAPVSLGDDVLDGATLDTSVEGDLTLRGATRRVTVVLQARLDGNSIEVAGTITIVFEEWGIPSPSRPGISVEDRGELEFLLVFSRD